MPAEAKTEPTATRAGYGDALADLGEEHQDVVALDADLASSTQAIKFGKKFPDRFFNVGAAEANMMSMACGLAATGKVPYCSTFAIFASGRAYDQVRLGIAHNELKVRIGASHGGVSLGEDAKRAATVGTVGWVGGGVLVGAGAVIFFTAPSASVKMAAGVGYGRGW